jgi:hypothetical protein
VFRSPAELMEFVATRSYSWTYTRQPDRRELTTSPPEGAGLALFQFAHRLVRPNQVRRRPNRWGEVLLEPVVRERFDE